MLAQQLLGLLQGCILGQMWYRFGLTTNGPDYHKLLCHVSFPEPMAASPSPHQLLLFRDVPVARATGLTARNLWVFHVGGRATALADSAAI
jgi:hypothetical protein